MTPGVTRLTERDGRELTSNPIVPKLTSSGSPSGAIS
jgi:hypothetical protein